VVEFSRGQCAASSMDRPAFEQAQARMAGSTSASVLLGAIGYSPGAEPSIRFALFRAALPVKGRLPWSRIGGNPHLSRAADAAPFTHKRPFSEQVWLDVDQR
jgi:hypothetical protein